MNKVLKLKGHFRTAAPERGAGFPKLHAGRVVTASHVRKLADDLLRIRREWPVYALNAKPVVSVYYERVVPKSCRVKRLLSDGVSPDATVVGAKFWYAGGTACHQIVHCVSTDALARAAEDLASSAQVLDDVFGGAIDAATLDTVNSEGERDRYSNLISGYGISRTPFSRVVVDSCYVDRFGVDNDAPQFDDDVFVMLYKTDLRTRDLFRRLELEYPELRSLDETTLLISRSEYDTLREKAPYLIAMSLADWTDSPDDTGDAFVGYRRSIPAPSNEPIIGVIDTLIEEDPQGVYFSDWVDARDMVDPRIPRDGASYLHGTCVSSIIVDGPSLNPLKDDGCGRFRVRHFGITASMRFSVFELVRNLRSIVANNTDIKVWNLSLGSSLEVPRFFISPIASIIDELQREYDVVFVVAGTNDDRPVEGELRYVGSPADSINALVVNAVRSDGAVASYARRGPVLDFFGKPDVAYFGGDRGDPCLTWALGAEHYSSGTSYAAPWIARKMAYLMQVVGLPREAAKALLIDSAAGWGPKGDPDVIGYGVVPTRIEDIVRCGDDEIRFVLFGMAGPYQTFNYNIPVPMHKGKQPYYSKATLCYFPRCSRNQGVDYTNTEIDFKLGRIREGKVKSENNDMQGEVGSYSREADLRAGYRKWDNVKVIGESVKQRKVPKKTYLSPFWGVSLTATRRLDDDEPEKLPFGIVVTLKEMNGVNRIDNFIQNCLATRWIVEEIDLETSVDVYAAAEQEIRFEDE